MSSMKIPESFKALIAKKQAAVQSKVPGNWKLPVMVLENIGSPILFWKDYRRLLSTGIFSQMEINITEKYDAAALIELMVGETLTAGGGDSGILQTCSRSSANGWCS
jgi:hypothetical protein